MRFALKPETFFTTRRGEAPSPTGRVAVSTSILTYRLNTPGNDCICTNFMNWKAFFQNRLFLGTNPKYIRSVFLFDLQSGNFKFLIIISLLSISV